MRTDFNRVLTEDPRRGSREKFRLVRRSKLNATFDEEFSGGKESMMTQRRRQMKQNRKTFGDHLGPLEGWVRKQVGRRWDDVYSELCELFDKRSQIKNHVHEHVLGDFVEIDTALIDGKVCIFNRWEGWIEVGVTPFARRRAVYVHPVTGLLCSSVKENEPGHAKKAEEARLELQRSQFRVHGKDTHLYFEDGIWMAYTMADRPPPHIEYRCPSWWRGTDRDRWEKMTLAEREREGSPVWVRTPVNEVKAPGVSYGSRYYYRKDMLPADRYYVEKRVASRKVLKLHGLVGTAEFKEGEGLSHREMNKYR